MFDVKRIEGRRFHRGVKYWSVPASLRAWKKLQGLGFTMLGFGGGPGYVSWLERGCPVGGIEGPSYGLFPYQRQGIARCLTRAKIVLADDPGLGKTWQAIEWARRRQHRKLVVAPKVVLGQWREAIRIRHSTTGDDVHTRLRASTWGVGEWNIVNYEYLPKLEEVQGDFDLIVDEAHLCTNTKAARTKHILKLSSNASRVLLLTGTPPAQPSRLWPFLLMTGERDAKEFFPYALRYCGAERNDFGWDFSGATHLDELKDELVHVMVRRTKAEVLSDLPPIMRTTLVIDNEAGTTGDRNAIIKLDNEIEHRVALGHKIDGIGEIQSLRAAASRQKIKTTIEYIQALGPTKVVVFCQFRETMQALIEGLADELPLEESGVAVIHGDTSDDLRQELISWFKKPAENEWNVLILQSGVGGLGLDGLQVASTAIVHDLPWTKDELDQIESRLHRQGQKSSVNIVSVLSTSRVEKKMLAAIQEGKELQEALGYAVP